MVNKTEALNTVATVSQQQDSVTTVKLKTDTNNGQLPWKFLLHKQQFDVELSMNSAMWALVTHQFPGLRFSLFSTLFSNRGQRLWYEDVRFKVLSHTDTAQVSTSAA